MWLAILLASIVIFFLFWGIRWIMRVHSSFQLIKLMNLDTMEIVRLGNQEDVTAYLYDKLVQMNRLFVWKIIRAMRELASRGVQAELYTAFASRQKIITDEKELMACLENIRTDKEKVVLFPHFALLFPISINLLDLLRNLKEESDNLGKIVAIFLRMANSEGGRRVEFLF